MQIIQQHARPPRRTHFPAQRAACPSAPARATKLAGRTDWVDLAWLVQRLTFGMGQTPLACLALGWH
jgi:hypothetical protein